MLSEGTSRKIEDAHPYLQTRIPLMQADYRSQTGRDIFITCTFRNETVQYQLWLQGRKIPGPACSHGGILFPIGSCKKHPLGLTVTQIDGKTRKSKHNLRDKDGNPRSRAVDFCVDLDLDVIKVRVSWKEHHYEPIIEIAKKHGLISGGSWKSIKDWPHVEMPNSIA